MARDCFPSAFLASSDKPLVEIYSRRFFGWLRMIWPQQKPWLAALGHYHFAFGFDKIANLGKLRAQIANGCSRHAVDQA